MKLQWHVSQSELSLTLTLYCGKLSRLLTNQNWCNKIKNVALYTVAVLCTIDCFCLTFHGEVAEMYVDLYCFFSVHKTNNFYYSLFLQGLATIQGWQPLVTCKEEELLQHLIDFWYVIPMDSSHMDVNFIRISMKEQEFTYVVQNICLLMSQHGKLTDRILSLKIIHSDKGFRNNFFWSKVYNGLKRWRRSFEVSTWCKL